MAFAVEGGNPTKTCRQCTTEKPTNEFPKNRNSRDGLGAYCKLCHNARNREAIRRLHGDTREYHFRQRYGITKSDFDQMVARQNGVCPICRQREATQVDHDHKTGKVRAILCLKCNAGLGALRDDLRLVWAAVDYLHPTPLEELIRL